MVSIMRKWWGPIVGRGRIWLRGAWLAVAVPLVAAAAPGASPAGQWLTEDNSGVVEIFRCASEDAWCGRLAWFRVDPGDPNPQGLDLRNPDPARRDRSLCGMTFMSGFRPAGPDSWDDGFVYNPDNGKTYHATMALQPDGRLRLRGYIGVPLLGESQVWTRFTRAVPSCPGR